MKRRSFLQLFGGSVVAVPLAKNLTFEVPEEAAYPELIEDYEWDYDGYDEPDTPVSYTPRGPGPHVGDIMVFDSAKVDIASKVYKTRDIMVCSPCTEDYEPIPGFDKRLGKWGEMWNNAPFASTITSPVDPWWPQNEKKHFKVEWFLVRNKTRNKPLLRIYMGEYGSNELGDLTITWNPSGLVTMV